jgi:branched-chain amino acid transport system substrate-binding protein
MTALPRAAFMSALSAAALTACAPRARDAQAGDGDPVRFGVSGPFSGDAANYGRVWRNAMDLAVDEIRTAGGRRLELVYQDTQSDPRQSVAVAQQFVDDPSILVELGDFSSAASIAASPIYERAGLVQFGFTNSDPAFTRGGSFMFSTATSVQQDAALLAARTARLGRRHAVLYQETVWGTSASAAYIESARSRGIEIVARESYLPAAKDFHAVLGNARASRPDVAVYFSYYTDGALLLQQARDIGFEARPVTTGACYDQQFIALGGSAVEGVILPVEFFAEEPRPSIRRFVQTYERRYNEVPDLFAAFAYDAVHIAAWAVTQGGLRRAGVRDALAQAQRIPSLVDGPFHFGPDRRVARARETFLIVRDGKFVLWRDA